MAAARRDAGRTQEFVAHEAGIAVSTLRNIEAGRSAEPGFFLVMTLCRILDLDPTGRIVTEPASTDPAGS